MYNLEPGSFFNFIFLLTIIVLSAIYLFKIKTLKNNNLILKSGIEKTKTDNEGQYQKLKVLNKEKEKIIEYYNEKINNLYRFAEFGKLSAGIFHDLTSPLTAVNLNLEQIKRQNKYNSNYFLKNAISANKKMQDFIISIKKQINNNEKPTYFNINQEIIECLNILEHKAKKNNVKLLFKNNKKNYIFGIKIKFNQIILNLISNSIDAYSQSKNKNRKLIIIKIKRYKNIINISVKDFGIGIDSNNKNKIYKPFFSTKNKLNNGLGLYCTKYNIEKYFNGKLYLISKAKKGTTALIYLQKNKHKCE